MTKLRRAFGVAWLLASLAAGGVLAATEPAPAETAEIAAKAEELKRLRQRIEQLQTDLLQQNSQRKGLTAGLREVEEELAQIGIQRRRIERDIEAQAERLDELAQDRADTIDNIATHRRALAKQVRSAYATGRQEKIKLLLNQQDPAIASRVLLYYGYLNRARIRQIDDLNAEISRLDSLEREIRRDTERLEGLRQAQLDEQRQFDDTRVKREQVLAKLSAEIRDKDERLEDLKADERNLQTLLGRLQEALADVSLDDEKDRLPFGKRKGKLIWPLQGRLEAGFGSAQQGGLRWEGVMIDAPAGSEVMAVHAGRVAFADWLRGYGLMVIVDHGDGYMSLYGHNQALLKETGDWVDEGEAIAQVGDSGGRPRPGLYFGIRFNGKPVNPAKWCRRSKGNRVGWTPTRSLFEEAGVARTVPLGKGEQQV